MKAKIWLVLIITSFLHAFFNDINGMEIANTYLAASFVVLAIKGD